MRLDQVEERFGDKVKIEWRSFLLRPYPEERTHEQFVRYTESWKRPAEMEPAATFRVWASENAAPSHSVPALVAGKIVESFGESISRTFHRNLLRAYFSENRTISELAVLTDVAEASGVARSDFLERFELHQDDATQAVLADHNAAIENEVHAVPTVLLAGVPIPGAQEVDTYVKIIERIIDRLEANGET